MDYLKKYNEFVSSFDTREVGAEEVGKIIVEFAQYYATFNLDLVKAHRKLVVIARDNENKIDGAGKAISSVKAGKITDATDEAGYYEEIKGHLQNIEVMIAALKSMQRGLLKEFNYQSIT